MQSLRTKNLISEIMFVMVIGAACLTLTGCQELDTVKRELWKKVETVLHKKKDPFVQRPGITIRACSLRETANLNAPTIRKIPAETSVQLVNKIGEFYRVRMRDGREGYVEQKEIGGEEIIQKTQELRRSIEGMPVQAEGMTKNKANFRLQAGREHEIIEVLPPDRKLEVYERVVTLRRTNPGPALGRGRTASPTAVAEETASNVEPGSDDLKKDVWYKVKIEDGRVGYIYTQNLKLTPPADIASYLAHEVPHLRLVGWRTVNTTDDPDRGAVNNYIVAFAPIGKDPGCDYTHLYFFTWSSKIQRRVMSWRVRLHGVLPISNYLAEGKPGFSIRYLHPSKNDKLVLSNFVYASGRVRKVGEEEIPNNRQIH